MEDEARHAELAWEAVAWAVARGGRDVRDRLAEAVAEGPPRFGADTVPPGAEGHGMLDAADLDRVVAATWRRVIEPLGADLLAA